MNVVTHHISNFPVPWFDYICNGIKKYEGRLASKIEEWDLRVGKELIFENSGVCVVTKVVSLKRFDSFGEAFDHPGIGQLLVPIDGIKSRDVDEMYSEIGFTVDRVKEAGGVVIIGIEVVR